MVSLDIDDDLLLRNFEPGDAQQLFNVINASRQHLRSWLHWVDATTREEHSLQFILDSLQQQETQQGIVLGIFCQGTIIGEVGMHQWDRTLKKAQLGYWISKDHEGKGILQTCLRRFISFLFEQTDLNKAEIHFIPQNKRSARLAERLGFKTEGYLRQSFLRNGMLEDLVITGLLRQEWNVS